MKYPEGHYIIEESRTRAWIREIVGFRTGQKPEDSQYQVVTTGVDKSLECSISEVQKKLSDSNTAFSRTQTITPDYLEDYINGESDHEYHVVSSLDELDFLSTDE